MRAAAAGISTSPATPPATEITTFSPYAATGTLVVPVADQRAGSCWTGSIAAPAPDTYRCFAGDQILDPCFAPPGVTRPATVACIADPWSAAQVVRLTDPLPQIQPQPGARPWALLLASGVRCTAVTGTVSSVAGVEMQYLCGGGAAAGIVSDDVNHMVVAYGPQGAASLARVAVRTAWRA